MAERGGSVALLQKICLGLQLRDAPGTVWGLLGRTFHHYPVISIPSHLQLSWSCEDHQMECRFWPLVAHTARAVVPWMAASACSSDPFPHIAALSHPVTAVDLVSYVVRRCMCLPCHCSDSGSTVVVLHIGCQQISNNGSKHKINFGSDASGH